MRGLAVVLGALGLIAGATAAPAEPARLDLAALVRRAQTSERGRMAQADRAQAAARVDEADAARWARVTATGFVAPSPHIVCVDPSCTSTDPSGFALDFEGVYAGGKLELTQPLFTFGKLSAVREAARLGLAAQDGLAAAAAGDPRSTRPGLLGPRRPASCAGCSRTATSRSSTPSPLRSAHRRRRHRRHHPGSAAVELLLAEARPARRRAPGRAQALAAVRSPASDNAADIDEQPLEPLSFALAPDEKTDIAAAKAVRGRRRPRRREPPPARRSRGPPVLARSRAGRQHRLRPRPGRRRCAERLLQ
jgi:hypothetical protein